MWYTLFMLLIMIIVIGLITFLYNYGGIRQEEGFAYNENPCKAYRNCRSCAGAAGCGWCADLGVCQPMAQDGFPIRTKDLTTGNPVVSPYLVEGVIPVVSDCPAGCKLSDLGDCDCSSSCAPECSLVYGKGCICPSDLGSVSQAAADSGADIIKRIAAATRNLNKLLKSTRIHICSPHNFVIVPEKC